MNNVVINVVAINIVDVTMSSINGYKNVVKLNTVYVVTYE